MREILFRGKTYGGEWVEGYLYKRIVHLETFHQNVVADAIEVYDGKSALSIAYYTVDANTIGQFTGLTDKNGTKIFEGDIGKSIDGIFLVCWDEEKAAFIIRFYDYPHETLYIEEMWDDAEIIGNIHDNPELIGG